MLRVKMSKGADPDATTGTGKSTPMPQPTTQAADQDPGQGDDSPDPADGPDDDSDGDSSPDGSPNGDPDQGKIDPQNAGYQGPDQGPFICANCIFFDNGHCEVVAGPIDHLGCCNNFSSMSASSGGGPSAAAPQGSPSGGNTIGDQSNGAQSATTDPTQALSNIEGA